MISMSILDLRKEIFYLPLASASFIVVQTFFGGHFRFVGKSALFAE